MRLLVLVFFVFLMSACRDSQTALPQLRGCGPAGHPGVVDPPHGSCWYAKEDIIVEDAFGTIDMGQNHGPNGPLLTSAQFQIVNDYKAKFGDIALWNALRPYRAQPLPNDVATSMAAGKLPDPTAKPKFKRVVNPTAEPPTPTAVPTSPPHS